MKKRKKKNRSLGLTMKQKLQYRKASKGKNKIYCSGRIAGLKGRPK